MIHYWFNIMEGFLWIGISGILYVRTARGTDDGRKQIARRAAIAFFWFGISDFVEAGTGAWYRPIGLLLMKSACVAVLVHCLVRYQRMNRMRESEPISGPDRAESARLFSCQPLDPPTPTYGHRRDE